MGINDGDNDEDDPKDENAVMSIIELETKRGEMGADLFTNVGLCLQSVSIL